MASLSEERTRVMTAMRGTLHDTQALLDALKATSADRAKCTALRKRISNVLDDDYQLFRSECIAKVESSAKGRRR